MDESIYGHNIAIIYRCTSTVVYVHNITRATIYNKMIFDWEHWGWGQGGAKKKNTHNLRSMDMTLHKPIHGNQINLCAWHRADMWFFETCAVWGRCWCNFCCLSPTPPQPTYPSPVLRSLGIPRRKLLVTLATPDCRSADQALRYQALASLYQHDSLSLLLWGSTHALVMHLEKASVLRTP